MKNVHVICNCSYCFASVNDSDDGDGGNDGFEGDIADSNLTYEVHPEYIIAMMMALIILMIVMMTIIMKVVMMLTVIVTIL